jgi:urease accessory protein
MTARLPDPLPAHPMSWPASLDLRFARRGEGTILAASRHEGPLRVQKALHPEGEAVCHAIVLHPPSGIVGGDHLRIAAAVGDGAHALLTTPGAGKWYRSAGPQATQALDFAVGTGGVLEWLPQESIVFDGAQARMDAHVRLAEDAVFIGWEVLCLGRRASGERFATGELRLATRIERSGRTLWLERGALAGGSPLLASPAGLAGRTVCATLLTSGGDVAPDLLAACRAVETPEAQAQCGISALPDLLVARYLGDSAEAARHWLESLRHVLRPALAGRAAQTPRIWNT